MLLQCQDRGVKPKPVVDCPAVCDNSWLNELQLLCIITAWSSLKISAGTTSMIVSVMGNSGGKERKKEWMKEKEKKQDRQSSVLYNIRQYFRNEIYSHNGEYLL